MVQFISFKSEINNPWFNPWFILLHTHSNVCATVEGRCLEYLVCITLTKTRKRNFLTSKVHFLSKMYYIEYLFYLTHLATQITFKPKKTALPKVINILHWKYNLTMDWDAHLEKKITKKIFLTKISKKSPFFCKNRVR